MRDKNRQVKINVMILLTLDFKKIAFSRLKKLGLFNFPLEEVVFFSVTLNLITIFIYFYFIVCAELRLQDQKC